MVPVGCALFPQIKYAFSFLRFHKLFLICESTYKLFRGIRQFDSQENKRKKKESHSIRRR